eukprot:372325-Alexandrium_andersonii.AAC.1
MSASLVGSEMCIRDREWRVEARAERSSRACMCKRMNSLRQQPSRTNNCNCLLYTSDAADDM